MALNKLLIGERIRKARVELFNETRAQFAKRCDLSERHIAQIERGEFVISIKTLDKIACSTGLDVEYILYGKGENSNLQIRQNLYNIINRADNERIKLYYKIISNTEEYMNFLLR